MRPGPPGSDPAPGQSSPLHPDLKERVDRLLLLARGAVPGAGHGVHRSARLGRGAEFAEHKAYSPGDEARHLDWRIAARSDRYVVKRFQADRSMVGHLLVDASPSMDFGHPVEEPASPLRPRSKWEAAAGAAAALAWVLLRQGDSVSAARAGEGAGAVLPPRRGVAQLPAVCHDIARGLLPGAAGLGDAVGELASRVRGRALVLVATDALDEDLSWIDALAALRVRGADVALLQVVDPHERDFPYRDPSRFEDLETGEVLRVNPRELARAYREEFRAFLDDVRARSLAAGLSHVVLDTGVPLDASIRDFLALRQRTRAPRNDR
ncbi:DUF58 domain-containing protein [Myxococcota bacterium]|nr:DUF58 domain-containing protein [Myxococcota bacterium]